MPITPNEFVVFKKINENSKWMERITSEKNARKKYQKAKGIVVAACHEEKIKLTEQEIVDMAFALYYRK